MTAELGWYRVDFIPRPFTGAGIFCVLFKVRRRNKDSRSLDELIIAGDPSVTPAQQQKEKTL